jgi:hypothetical protein
VYLTLIYQDRMPILKIMKRGARPRELLPDLSVALARFPGPAIASFVMAMAANMRVGERSFAGGQFYDDMLWSAAAAFLAAGAAHLFAESRIWEKQRNIAFALLIGVLAAFAFWFHGALGLYRPFFTIGLVFLLMIAAYLRRASQAAFWLFNLRLGLAALLAIIVAAVTCGGISAILASLELLFDIKIPNDLYQHAWLTGMTLLGPFYGLAVTPGPLNEEIDLDVYRNSMLERGLSVLIAYILIPFVLVYAAILHAYAAKIALAWTLPKGQVASLVTSFALTGTAAYLISYPWRSSGTALLRMFRSAWFPLTLVPVVLLIIGTLRRIEDYGITPQRYALMVIAAWLIGLILVFFSQRRVIDIRHIVGSFAILALVTAIGPWGARTFSMNDQYGRLERLLTTHGFLMNGRLAETSPPTVITETERQMARSIIYLLVNEGEQERFRSWFEGRASNPWLREDFQPHLVTESLVKIIGAPSDLRMLSYTSSLPSTFPIARNAIIVGPIRLYGENRPQLEQTSRIPRVENRGAVLAFFHGSRTWLIRTGDLLAKATEADSLPDGRLPFAIDLGDPQNNAMLIVDELSGEFEQGVPKVHSGKFWLVLPN